MTRRREAAKPLVCPICGRKTRLLLRNEGLLFDRQGPCLVVDPPHVDDAERLARSNTTLWIRHHRVTRAARDRELGPLQTDALWAPAPQHFETIVLYLPKGRRAQRMTFSQLRPALAVDGTLFVVGENQAGIKSCAKDLRAAFGTCRAVDAARRCTLLDATASTAAPPFDPEPWFQRWTATVDDRDLAVRTLAGTFSDGELDVGTAELLTALADEPLPGRIVDLGSGGGVIGGMIAKYHPDTRVVLADVNACAVASSRATIAANELDNATAVASDWYSDVDGAFDTVVCNPPFHEGIATDRTMVRSVVQQAPHFLRTNGRLWIVANRFLPYLDELQAVFQKVEIVRQTSKFRVYRSWAPASAQRHQPKRSGSSRKR